MKKILTIIGPTASGKTSLAVNLSKKLNAEVIGLDSRQIYSGMSIGTAQPTTKEMRGVKHHLIGFQDPSDPISAGQYAKLITDKVKNIQADGRNPIICGGAGLYYRAISKGIFQGSVSDPINRNRLEKLYDNNPSDLLGHLRAIDPEYADLVHINNKKRLVRALEIFEATGKTPSEHFHDQKSNPTTELDLFTIEIKWKQNVLNERIENRADEMLDRGWIEEVETLLKQQSRNKKLFTALSSIGYSQIQSYLSNKIPYEEMREDIIIKTRQFARRQVKWFAKEPIDLSLEMDNLETKEIVQILYCLFQVII